MSVGPDVEVLVVGAGPAGSSAARTLAESGVSVLILDREDFPRYKTCGGGIIGVTRSCIPAGAPYRDEIYEATFSLRGHGSRLQRSQEPIMATVDRKEFDTWLLRGAQSSGATFTPSISIHSASVQADQVVAITGSGERITSRYLIDASGTSSRIAKQLGVSLQTLDLGLELELGTNQFDTQWHHRIHLDWGPIPGSYGWLFPKGDSLTVGVIAAKGEPDKTRRYLKDLTLQLGLENSPVLKESGHLTRCRSTNSPLGHARILLAGDAAGLLEPWTREGLSFATRSGQMAGEVLARSVRQKMPAEAAVPMYRARLEQSILSEMRAGFEALHAFERHPEIFHALMAYTRFGWKYFTRITSGDTNVVHALRHPSIRFALEILGGSRSRNVS